MSWKEAAEPVLVRMPAVNRPEGHVPFKRKLLWTAGILVLYFYLTNVTLYGLEGAQPGDDFFGQFRSILAGEHGSIMQVGIGPIVTASIVMQLLGGADLLGLDTNDPRDQVLYQGLQKLLVIVMTVLTAFPMVFAGGFLPIDGAVAASLGVSPEMLMFIVFAQVVVGGILILFMDEIVSKWGIGSGIGLFIIAGVSQRLFSGFIGWESLTGHSGLIPTWVNIILGRAEGFPSLLTPDGIYALFLGEGEIIALVTTVLIFAIVVYAESVRVEIPLAHARVKGARGRFPVKLMYASVLPIILVRALQANIQFMGRILDNQTDLPAWAGTFSDGQPTGGLFYYLAPIHQPGDWMWWGAGQAAAIGAEPWQVAIRVAVDMSFMVIGGAIFAVFWVETTGMGPDATAEQIQRSGMQIPGFRQNVDVLEKVMQRYIPQVTVVGGALVGFLAVMANMLGTIGQVDGTGLLLTVSITYKLYEEIAEEQLMEMHPMMRQMFGRA